MTTTFWDEGKRYYRRKGVLTEPKKERKKESKKARKNQERFYQQFVSRLRKADLEIYGLCWY